MAKLIHRVFKKSGTGGVPTVLSIALLAMIVAMAVLPLATPGGVSAANQLGEERDNKPPIVIDLPTPTPTPAPDIDFDGPILIEQDGDDQGDEDQGGPVIVDPDDIEPRTEGVDGDDGGDGDVQVTEDVQDAIGDAVAPSGIYITKYVCPEGFDALAADLSGLFANCPTTAAAFEFNLTINGQPIGSQSVGDVQASAVVWQVQPGFVLLQETLPLPDGFGLPRVFCDLPEGAVEMQLINTTIQFDLPAGDNIDCEWFNILEGDGGDGLPEGDSSVTVTKHECPVGYDASGADIYGLVLDCQGTMTGVTFLIADGNGGSESQVTGGDSAVTYSGLAGGPYVVLEQVPAGYGEPVVFCETYSESQPNGSGPIPMLVSDGNQIFEVLDPAVEMYCDWFNFPTGGGTEGGDSSIHISKTACPVGYDAYAADIYDLVFNCQDVMADVKFAIGDGGGFMAQGNTDANGFISFLGLAAAPYAVVETVPPGYGEPIVYCESYSLQQPNGSGPISMLVTDGNQIFEILDSGVELHCNWFNVPAEYDGEDGDVVVEKRGCPLGFDAYSADQFELVLNCQEPKNGVQFNLYYGVDTIVSQQTGEVGQSAVVWQDVPAGPLAIQEYKPDGYGEPVVYCEAYSLDQPNGSGLAKFDVIDGHIVDYDLQEGESLYCSWYNVPTENDEPGSITVYKYTCEAGYGPFAPGADPAVDCPNLTNGITFEFGTPGDLYLQSDTGDSIDGAVTFGGLDPGTYHVFEQVPAGIDKVFVTTCEGSSSGQIQNYPLSVGASLTIDLAAGDDIVCYWYNVPVAETGTIVVEKFYCVGQVFVNDINCEIYESGAGFELSAWTGNGWIGTAQGTTDAYGSLVFNGLLAGTYELDEVGGEWCYAAADRTDDDGNLIVVGGKQTHVDVYNCGGKQPTKQPVKYPNTGVGGPVAVVPDGPEAPVSSIGEPVVVGSWLTTVTQWAIEEGVTGNSPVTIRSEAIGVVAKIEVLEIVNGEIQDPTSADQVAWYKDTARLGSAGNVVMAGHLNYWGVPEGVFFRLDQFKPGDVIEVTGENGVVHQYEVEWVKQADAFAAPGEEIVGQTDEATLTLITCGGQWDPSVSLYNQRTVVRAVLVTA